MKRAKGKNREKQRILIFLLVFFVVVYIVSAIERRIEEATINSILDNPAYAVCKINRVQYSGHRNKYDTHRHVELGYSYEINGIWYNAATVYNYVSGGNLEGAFLGKQIMIIYCRTEVEKRRALISMEDYNEVGLPLPAGREWVSNYIEGVGSVR